MKINFTEIKPSNFLIEKLEINEDIKEYFNNFNNLKFFTAKIYVNKEIENDRFLGIKNIWMIFQLKKKYFKINFNISFNNLKENVELYIKKFIPFNKKIENGVEVEFSFISNIDASNFIMQIKKIEKSTNFIQIYEDNSNILKAIQVYEEITKNINEKSEQKFLVNSFKRKNVFSIDKLALENIDIKAFHGKDYYIYEEDKERVPLKNLSKKIFILWELESPIKIASEIKKTFASIIKDSGDLYISKDQNFLKFEKSIKLIDFKIQRINNTQSKIFLITDKWLDDEDYNYFFHIVDRLRHRKRKTMLSVIDDIKKNRINNNNIFQFLFNNGKYENIVGIKNWRRNKSLIDKYSSNLHENQKKAFDLSVDNFPITFIQGPPGTGKTHIITQISKYYNHQGKKVLLSSQTNVAVENILKNLWEDNNFQDLAIKADYKSSIYSEINIEKQINQKIKNILGLKNDVNFKNVCTSEEIFKSNIIGSTTTSSAISTRKWNNFYDKFEVLIIDEISKSSVPELIRYIINAKKIILVGDQRQLAPLDEIDKFDEVWNEYNEEDKYIIKNYISLSIFDKLFKTMKKNKRAIMLDINRRSLPIITNTYSFFYDDKLKSYRNNNDSKIIWKENVKPLYPFSFIGMNGGKEIVNPKTKSRFNVPEAHEVGNIIKELYNKIQNSKDLTIAIITFYGAQIEKIKDNLSINEFKELFKDIKIDTVDSFQGDQADIVILSTVREAKTLSTGFIDDYRRINVAISRAKDLVIMLGNDYLLKNIVINIDNKSISYYNELFKMLEKDGSKEYEKPITYRKVG